MSRHSFDPAESELSVELIDRYLAGTCTPPEQQTMLAALQELPRLQMALEILRAAPAPHGEYVDVDTAWREIERLISASRNGNKHLARPPIRWVWPTVAAVALALLVTVVSWNAGARHMGQRAAASMLTYTTGNGERATITLPDGGTVALNVASHLEIPMDYTAGDHTVRLIGEGIFTLPHHRGAPFAVRTAGGATARVLGTTFLVRRYPSDTTALVAVQEGKVALGATVVTANHLAEVGQSGMPHIDVADPSVFSFATGTLVLNGLPLSAALIELDRWYDADIRLGDPVLATQRVQGDFAAGSLNNLATILELTFNVRAVRMGRVLTLYSRH